MEAVPKGHGGVAWREQRRTAGACRVGGPGHRLSVRDARKDEKVVPESKWILSDRVAKGSKSHRFDLKENPKGFS